MCLGFFFVLFCFCYWGWWMLVSPISKCSIEWQFFLFNRETNNTLTTKKPLFFMDRKTTSLGKQTLMNSLYADETTWVANWIVYESFFFGIQLIQFIYKPFLLELLSFVIFSFEDYFHFFAFSWGLLIGIIVMAFFDDQ